MNTKPDKNKRDKKDNKKNTDQNKRGQNKEIEINIDQNNKGKGSAEKKQRNNGKKAYLRVRPMEDVVLQSYNMETKEELHEELMLKFGFPQYYGKNLDALNDMLTEISEDTLILLFGEKELSKRLGDYASSFLSVIKNTCSENPHLFFFSEDSVANSVMRNIK